MLGGAAAAPGLAGANSSTDVRSATEAGGDKEEMMTKAVSTPQQGESVKAVIPARLSPSGMPFAQGLYDPRNEHDACGVGFIAHMKGQKSHQIVKDGLFILENLTHRGAVGADPLMGDGAGILVQIPDRFFREEMAKQGVTLPKAGEYAVGHIFMRATRSRSSTSRR